MKQKSSRQPPKLYSTKPCPNSRKTPTRWRKCPPYASSVSNSTNSSTNLTLLNCFSKKIAPKSNFNWHKRSGSRCLQWSRRWRYFCRPKYNKKVKNYQPPNTTFTLWHRICPSESTWKLSRSALNMILRGLLTLNLPKKSHLMVRRNLPDLQTIRRTHQLGQSIWTGKNPFTTWHKAVSHNRSLITNL